MYFKIFARHGEATARKWSTPTTCSKRSCAMHYNGLGTAIICLSCVTLHVVYCELSRRTRKKIHIFPTSDKIAFSPDNVHKKYHWVWITGSTLHADRSHLMNNLLFILGFAPNLETFIFRRTVLSHTWYEMFISHEYMYLFYFLGIYYICGIAGWLVTYMSHRFINFPKQWKLVLHSILQALEAPQICTALLYLLLYACRWSLWEPCLAKNMSGSWFT